MQHIQGDQAELGLAIHRQMQLGAAHAIGIAELPRPLAGDHIDRPHAPGLLSCGSGRAGHELGAMVMAAGGAQLAAQGGQGAVHLDRVPGDRHHQHQGDQGPGDLQTEVALDRIPVLQVVFGRAVEQQRPEDHAAAAQKNEGADAALQGEEVVDQRSGAGGRHRQPAVGEPGHTHAQPDDQGYRTGDQSQAGDREPAGRAGSHGRASRRSAPAASSWSAAM